MNFAKFLGACVVRGGRTHIRYTLERRGLSVTRVSGDISLRALGFFPLLLPRNERTRTRAREPERLRDRVQRSDDRLRAPGAPRAPRPRAPPPAPPCMALLKQGYQSNTSSTPSGLAHSRHLGATQVAHAYNTLRYTSAIICGHAIYTLRVPAATMEGDGSGLRLAHREATA